MSNVPCTKSEGLLMLYVLGNRY